MKCVKCRSQNVNIELMQSGGRTRKHGTGFGGKMNNTARGASAIATVGMSNLFWKKSKGTESMKYKAQKIALCQKCGHSWTVR
ncbi:hypothetical protein GCM10009720_14650 [Yaniella flava]|uniref:50S ribosomal protein L44e n=1 Tax=Yaniella flava TaxID=287930 RepID=A0ABN2UFG5_9MICC